MSELNGKVALVTGASSGIGYATALLLARAGADVAVTYLHNQPGAEQCAAEMKKCGVEALAVQSDLSETAHVKKTVEEVRSRLGPIDILVNNAGSLVKRARLLEVTEKDWDAVIDLNLKSVFFCCQAVAREMMQRRSGVIVNVSSVAGRNGGGPGAMHYASAKAAVIALTKGLARELAAYNIRVNAVAPGVIDTPYHKNFSTPELIESFIKTIPLSRMGTSEEVAHSILFLATDASTYITGETIEINGGMMML